MFIQETIVTYDPRTEQWQTHPAEITPQTARARGELVAYPAGIEGKLAAHLAALEEDAPDLSAAIQAIATRPEVAQHPRCDELIDRLIRGALIVRRDHVRIIRDNHFMVRSQAHPMTDYSVWWHMSQPYASCQCTDWFNGRAKHDWRLHRTSYAPFIPGFGLACQHILAARLAHQITPLWQCPDCDGVGFSLIENPTDAAGRPLYGRTQTHYCDPCTLCRGRGILFVDPAAARPASSGPAPAPRPQSDEIQAIEFDDETRNILISR